MRAKLRNFLVANFSFLYSYTRKFELYLSAIFGRVHEQDFYSLREYLSPGAHVLDIGANFGQSVTSMSSICDGLKITLFECNPSCKKDLIAVSKINSLLRRTSVTSYFKCLSNVDGKFTFRVPRYKAINFLQEGSFDHVHIDMDMIASRVGCDVSELGFTFLNVDVLPLTHCR